jgi:hypothetical protein
MQTFVQCKVILADGITVYDHSKLHVNRKTQQLATRFTTRDQKETFMNLKHDHNYF